MKRVRAATIGGVAEEGIMFSMSTPHVTADRAVRAVRDVLLVPTSDVVGEDWREHPPAGEPPVALGRNIWLTQHIDGVGADRIMDACELRGENFSPRRLFGCRYAFVRDLQADEYGRSHSSWDHDQSLLAAFTLSRPILDNAYSTQYSARIIEFSDESVQIIPGPVNLEGSLVYRTRSNRDWLDYEEAIQLGALLGAFWRDEHTLGGRIANAIWLAEQASRRYYSFEALITIISGLEALTNTGPHQIVKQFVQRVPALAAEVGVGGLSRTMARRLYDQRSEPAHGRRLTLIPGRRRDEPMPNYTQREAQAMSELALIHDVLRAAVRKGIEQPAFRAYFTDDEAVRNKWPVADAEGNPV